MSNKAKGGIAALIVAAVLALIFGTGVGASAGSLITGKNLASDSVKSRHITDGAVKQKDLSLKLQRELNQIVRVNDVQSQQIAALQHKIFVLENTEPAQGPAGPAGQDGKDGSVAGVQKNWVAKDGSSIVNAHTVALSNVGTPAGASVEITELNLPVQATKSLSFTYELADGAAYSAGSPRVFIEINGNFFNTFDGAPSDAGVDNGDGTFTKTVTIPQNGRVGAAGIVVDNGVGSVTVSDLTIDGQVLEFK